MTEPANAWSLKHPMVVGVITLMILIGGFGGWSVTATLSGAVIASGQVIVDRNRQTIQHPDGGRVAEVLVGEGERVAAAQVLMRLDPSALHTELAVVRANLAEVQARRARLEAERNGAAEPNFSPELLSQAATADDIAELIAGQRNLFAVRAEALASEIAQQRARATQINAQVEALDAQRGALADQIALLDAELTRRQGLLTRGTGTQEPVVQLQRDLVQLSGAVGEIAARRAEAAERTIEIELAILQLEAGRREQAITELRDVRLREQELQERAADLMARIAATELRAPVAGHIHGLTIFGEGAVLRPAEAFAYLVPEGRPLVISARIPVIDIDQVFIGQRVSLVFPAFDRSDMPDVTGELARISADTFTDDSNGTGFYQAEITIPEAQAARLGDRTLVPGMSVLAYIETEARSPMTYLLEPFSDYFSSALRES